MNKLNSKNEILNAIGNDPLHMLELTIDELFSFEMDELNRIHLLGLQRRFNELRPQLPPLSFLAQDNRIDSINSINDIVPLLYPHTEYKSYPLSLIDNSQFELLNEWLNDFTTHDLSQLDLKECESLDDWLNMIERYTPVRVVCSSGTSGKITLLPRSTSEEPCIAKQFELGYAKFGDETGFADPYGPDVYHVQINPRKGWVNSCRSAEVRVKLGFGGDESRVLTLAGELSSDVLWMTGRLKKAQIDGNLAELKETKAWRRLHANLENLQTNSKSDRESFYQVILAGLKEKSVAMAAGFSFYWEMLECSRKNNLDINFAENSCLLTAGGRKGKEGLDEQKLTEINEAFPKLNDVYGCSELTALARRCREGHYHMPPSIVSFVLDPDTGATLPRSGVQTGRYAAFDLWATTYWAGIITGDKVTINWDSNCDCGRKGPFFQGEITRFADEKNGDDKITCQRSAAAVEEMLESLKQS